MPTIPNLIFCNLGFKEPKKWVVMWCQWQLSWFGILLMIVNLVVHSSSFHSHSLCVFISSWTRYKRRRFQVICLLTDVSSEKREREELWGRNVLPLSNHFLYLESLRLTIDFDWKGKEKRGRRRMKKSSWERRNDFFLLPCVTKNGEKESRRTLRQEERERKK